MEMNLAFIELYKYFSEQTTIFPKLFHQQKDK